MRAVACLFKQLFEKVWNTSVCVSYYYHFRFTAILFQN